MTWTVQYQLDSGWYTATHDNGRRMIYAQHKTAARKAKLLWREMHGQRPVAIVPTGSEDSDLMRTGVEEL